MHAETRLIMGMSCTVTVRGERPSDRVFQEVFDYFHWIDGLLSPYRPESEVTRINRGELSEAAASPEVARIIGLCRQTEQETEGYFNAWRGGRFDPSGLVKGRAISEAAQMLRRRGLEDFMVEIAGDLEVASQSTPWRIGLRNPLQTGEIIKVIEVRNAGAATSGEYLQPGHIYNPLGEAPGGTASLTVIGPDAYEADRFATAAYAMGDRGIGFIDGRPGLEGYQIDRTGKAIYTLGMDSYV